MCSSTRGPASAPSLVTWPTSTIVVPLALAVRVSCAAHSRTCATEPGAEVSCSEYRVWIESITQNRRLLGLDRGQDLLELDLGQHAHLRCASRPRRRARSATCAPLSSPVTYSAVICARQRIERLQQQRRLADARVAADQHHAAGDDAAAEHAVELVDAGRRGARPRPPRSRDSVATGCVATGRALCAVARARRRLRRRLRRACSRPRSAGTCRATSGWCRRTRCRCRSILSLAIADCRARRESSRSRLPIAASVAWHVALAACRGLARLLRRRVGDQPLARRRLRSP